MKKNVVRRVISRHGKDKATMQNIIRSLFMHGAVKLSVERAKDIQRHAEKLASAATVEGVVTLRLLTGKIGSVITAKSIMDYAKSVGTKRTSGFTRVEKMHDRRGDGMTVARLSLVDFVKPEKVVKKAVAPVKKVAPVEKEKEVKKVSEKKETKKVVEKKKHA